MALTSKTFSSLITFTRASSGTRINASGLIETVGNNVARFDYDPVTLAPKGLLIEEQRTNLLTYSNDFSITGWWRTNITLGAAITGPDGLASLAKVEASTTGSTFLQKTVTSAGSTSGNTYSVYAKKGSGATDCNTFYLRNSTTATNLVGLTINYDTGALTYAVGSGPATATNCGNGIWRIPLTATSGISASDTLVVYVGFWGVSETAGEYAYIGFCQLEAGSFATSYIPTTSAQVTRAADVAIMTGTNFSDWYNQTEGTFVVECDTAKPTAVAASAIALVASDGSANNRSMIRFLTGNAESVSVSAGSANAQIQQAYVVNAVERLAFGIKANDYAFARNGALVGTDAVGALSGTMDRLEIGLGLNGHIRRLTYYPTRLSNALLASLTA